MTLSGGQKQRVTLARGLIRNTAILILDDCFSSVDTETEEHILSELKRLRKTRQPYWCRTGFHRPTLRPDRYSGRWRDHGNWHPRFPDTAQGLLRRTGKNTTRGSTRKPREG